MSTETQSKPKKSVDDLISDGIAKLGALYQRKYSNTKLTDFEKSLARIASNSEKAKTEGKGSKTKKQINSVLSDIMSTEAPHKEHYLSTIAVLARASLDAQSRPATPKTNSSG